MSKTAKLSIIAWWVLIVMAIILWYRNVTYDRVAAGVLLVLAMIQLITYAAHNAVRPSVTGNLVIVTLGVLLLITCVGTYIYTNNAAALVTSAVAVVINMMILYRIWVGTYHFSCTIDRLNNYPKWKRDSSDILGYMWIVFVVCFAVCWLCMLIKLKMKDLGLYVIALYVFFCVVYATVCGEDGRRGPLVCYMMCGLSLIVWFTGMMNTL